MFVLHIACAAEAVDKRVRRDANALLMQRPNVGLGGPTCSHTTTATAVSRFEAMYSNMYVNIVLDMPWIGPISQARASLRANKKKHDSGDEVEIQARPQHVLKHCKNTVHERTLSTFRERSLIASS